MQLGRTFPLSALWRALGDDVDDLKRHHYFAGLIDYLDERGDRAAIVFDFEGTALSTVTRTDRVSPGRTGLTRRIAKPIGAGQTVLGVIRFGSKADICGAQRHVLLYPRSDIKCDIMECPLWAKSGLLQCKTAGLL